MDDDFFASSGPVTEGRTGTNVFDEVLVAAQPKTASQPASQPNSQPSSPPRPTDDDLTEAAQSEPVVVAAAAPAVAAAAPVPVATPVASPVAPSQSPVSQATTNNAAEYQSKVQELQKQISERTAAADKATLEKEDRQKKAAQAYIAEEKSKREKKLKIVHEDHRKEQAEYEKKTADLKKAGATWSSLGVVVDLKKPNAFSKKTDRMKQVLINLEAATHQQPVK